MMIFRLLAFMVLMQIVWVSPADAQTIVVGRMSSPEEIASLTKNSPLDKQLRLGVDVGYSYRHGKVADDIPDDFARQMRSGMNFGADLIYFPVEMWGIGIKVNGRIFNAEMNGAIRLTDITQMYYFAPILVARIFDRKNRNAWVLGVSAGYLKFREKVYTPYSLDRLSKSGLGTTWEIGYDIRISKKCFFGPKLSITSGSVNIDTYDGETKRESAYSTDLSLGFRF